MRTDATHALLGSDGIGSVGVISWHTNELEAYREAKRINDSGGKVRVVPVLDGELTPKYQAEKAKLFADRYNAVIGYE